MCVFLEVHIRPIGSLARGVPSWNPIGRPSTERQPIREIHFGHSQGRPDPIWWPSNHSFLDRWKTLTKSMSSRRPIAVALWQLGYTHTHTHNYSLGNSLDFSFSSMKKRSVWQRVTTLGYVYRVSSYFFIGFFLPAPSLGLLGARVESVRKRESAARKISNRPV